MSLWEADLADLDASDFVHELPEAAITFEGRRFLLVPIEGAGENHEQGEAVTLSPLPMTAFNGDNGWPKGTQHILSYMALGESLKHFDGIAQSQAIIRVV